jgi:hypothetical protein
MLCGSCMREFCGKCLLAAHDGDCDKQEVLFFERNLHYRQCKKCGFVIEKNQGCNHMTCRCSNQFCYVCGASWNNMHHGEHDENGELIVVVRNEDAAVVAEEDCCEECCRSCDQCCLGIALKWVFKLFLLLLLFLIMMLLFMCRDVIVIILMFVISIVGGLFGFSFEILCEQEGVFFILGIIFFPAVMVIGIVRAFREVFCETVGELCSTFWLMASGGASAICDI